MTDVKTQQSVEPTKEAPVDIDKMTDEEFAHHISLFGVEKRQRLTEERDKLLENAKND